MAETVFHPVARERDIPEGEMLRVEVGNRHIALYNLAGRIFATQALCTHGHALLTDGYIEGEHVECPMHGGSFDIPTGAAVGAPCVTPLAVYPVAVEGGEVKVGVAEA